MLGPGTPELIAKLCLWEATSNASLLNLASGNSGLCHLAGSLDVSSAHWRNLVTYKVPRDAHWNRIANAAEAAIRRLLREGQHHASIRVIAVEDMQQAYQLASSIGLPPFAFQRLATLAMAGRCELHVSWTCRPWSRHEKNLPGGRDAS